jgi:D-alanyl-D-alanine carboxypeptidase (penicillin-binding protein 5/6)
MQRILFKFIIFILFINFPEFIRSEIISSNYAVLMEEKTGTILYQKNMNVKRPIASLTKIMTAIIVLENANLKDYVEISPRAKYRYTGESLLNLEFNEKITVEELLYALLLRSANDAAVALAEHVSKSVENFVSLMNKKAKEIGAKNTHFSNPHGFSGENNHYSTCYDLALITRYALKNKKFNEIIKTKQKLISWGKNPYLRVLKNRNKLLWRYKYCDGVKTGMTKKAGYCLVASATKNGIRLISVVLNSTKTKMWEDSISLLEYGFNNYNIKK